MVFVLKFGFLRGSRLASLLNRGTLVQGTAMRIFEGKAQNYLSTSKLFGAFFSEKNEREQREWHCIGPRGEQMKTFQTQTKTRKQRKRCNYKLPAWKQRTRCKIGNVEAFPFRWFKIGITNSKKYWKSGEPLGWGRKMQVLKIFFEPLSTDTWAVPRKHTFNLIKKGGKNNRSEIAYKRKQNLTPRNISVVIFWMQTFRL